MTEIANRLVSSPSQGLFSDEPTKAVETTAAISATETNVVLQLTTEVIKTYMRHVFKYYKLHNNMNILGQHNWRWRRVGT